MTMRKMIDAGIDWNRMFDLIDVTLAYTCVNGLLPGTVETWNGIVDVSGVSLFELPVN